MGLCNTCRKAAPADECTTSIKVGNTLLEDGTDLYVYIKNIATDTLFRYRTSVDNGEVQILLEYGATYPFMGGHCYEMFVALCVDPYNNLEIEDINGEVFDCITFPVMELCEEKPEVELCYYGGVYSEANSFTIKLIDVDGFTDDDDCCCIIGLQMFG